MTRQPKPAVAATALLLLALAAAWLLLRRRPSNRVIVRPAAVSVSWENYLEEMDDEQRRWEGMI